MTSNGSKLLLELERRLGELVRKSPKSPSEVEEMLKRGDAFSEALRQEAEPLFNELAEVGIRIKSVWNLVNTSTSYLEAIPILVRHLSKPYHHRNKEGIVRALAVKEAKGIANKGVMDEYHKGPKEDHHFRWAFGNTMSVIVTKDDQDELIEIVLDESNGDSRTGFIEALAKLKSPKVIDVLHQLENDKSQIVAERAQKMLSRKAKAQERTGRKKP